MKHIKLYEDFINESTVPGKIKKVDDIDKYFYSPEAKEGTTAGGFKWKFKN